jgi:hypothetical protein
MLRANSVKRGQLASEDVVQTAKLSGSLDGTDVGGFLDDADDGSIATRIATNGAELTLGEIEAARARMHPLREGCQGLREAPALLRWLLEQMIRESQRRFPADARKLRELGREKIDC